MKPKWFWCEVFQRNIYFFYKWKLEDYVNYLNKYYKAEINPEDMFYTRGEVREITYKGNDILMVFVKNDRKIKTLDTAVHECNHLGNHIFKQHGVKLDLNNDEFETYYKAMLFRKCIE